MTQALDSTSRPASPGNLDKPDQGFDLCGKLPQGTLALQASAGTGKTYAVAALAARYVAEGVATLGELMIVTFSRLATQELKDRVRQRLVGVAQELDVRIADPGRAAPTDAVTALLCDAPSDELRLRRARILDALAQFDGATIATTHEFCDRMLRGLGVLVDHDPATRLVDNIDQLIRQTCSDEFLRRYADGSTAPFTFAEALEVCRKAMAQPGADLVPQEATGKPAERVDFVAAVRGEVEARKRRLGVYTFDDMLLRLRDALADEITGPAARRRLQELYRIVIVDEFQDTDPVQWQIVRDAFVGKSTVVLIGDPKQSIYGFRGADVEAYLDAIQVAGQVESLGTNFRSDSGVVNAVQAIFEGAALGDPRITVTPVSASQQSPRITSATGAPWCRPVRMRLVTGDEKADPQRAKVDADLCADVVALLESDVQLTHPDGRKGQVRPSDIAVLVSRNARGQAIQAALAKIGVPAVFAGAASVYQTQAAGDWLTLLRALDQPRPGNVRRAALTSLVGWDFPTLAQATDESLGELTTMLRNWSRLLDSHGVAALYEVVRIDSKLPEKLLGQLGGERLLTDIRHVAESLHVEQHARRLGAPGLVEWLSERIDDARARGDEERSRRLETDAEAVTITTVHQAKGLEYPIVYLPEASDRHLWDDDGQTLLLHQDGRRVLDVGGLAARGRLDRFEASRSEDADESLRSLYVALTRARCHVTTWWVQTKTNTTASPLHRLLFRELGVSTVPGRVPVTEDPTSLSRLAAAGIAVEPVTDRPLRALSAGRGDIGDLAVRRFTRQIDSSWRRTSYSALTAEAHAVAALEIGFREPDEGDVEGIPTPAAEGDLPSPMAELPGGTVFGSLVHAVFEFLDPAEPDLREALRRLVTSQTARLPVPGVDVEELTTALLPGLRTSLGPLAGGASLVDIPARDRLAELNFELRLDAEPSGRMATLARVAELLELHLPASDPLRDYPSRLLDSGLGENVLHGFLNGSIDALLRVGEPRRYLVADYKTNRLAPPEVPLTVGHYSAAAMAEAMMGAHYPLQALFYLVAAHRYLRWRLPSYDPDRDLGGALYLFVRGMSGPDNPVLGGMGAGVFEWRPPTALVTDVSDLLAGKLSGASPKPRSARPVGSQA